MIFPLFFACSSDNEEIEGQTQDYTSIVVENKTGSNLYNVVLGLYDGDKYSVYQKIGDIKFNESTNEIFVNSIKSDVYLFYSNSWEVVRLNNTIDIKKNSKNIITITRNAPKKIVNDWTDPSQYPN